jgi:hypothetical protein
MLLLARLVRTATAIAVALIVIAIVLHLVSANPHNAIVSDIHDAGNWLVSPFHNLFSIKGKDAHMIVNWGVAAVVYAIVGGFIARMLARAATAGGGVRRARPVT